MTVDDWRAAEDEVMRLEAERLGGPPAPEEVAAYVQSQLSDAEAVRIRALLVYYPGLTDLLLTRGPSVRAKRNMARTVLPYAAMLIVGFLTGLLVRSGSSDAPRVFDVPHELHPIGAYRGSSSQRPYPLPGTEQNYLLVLLVGREASDRHFRIDLVNSQAASPSVIWRSATLERVESRPFTISLPRELLAPGTYELRLYGVDGEPHHVATYSVRVMQ